MVLATAVVFLAWFYIVCVIVAFVAPWITVTYSDANTSTTHNYFLWTYYSCYSGANYQNCDHADYPWYSTQTENDRKLVAGVIIAMILTLLQLVLALVGIFIFGMCARGVAHHLADHRYTAGRIFLACTILALICWVVVVALLAPTVQAWPQGSHYTSNMSGGFAFQVIAFIVGIPLTLLTFRAARDAYLHEPHPAGYPVPVPYPVNSSAVGNNDGGPYGKPSTVVVAV